MKTNGFGKQIISILFALSVLMILAGSVFAENASNTTEIVMPIEQHILVTQEGEYIVRMNWFNSNSQVKITAVIDGQSRSVDIGTFEGNFPSMPSDISLGILKAGDSLVFSHTTKWHGTSYGPFSSLSQVAYKVTKVNADKWKIVFDDGLNMGNKYDDGAFEIYRKSELEVRPTIKIISPSPGAEWKPGETYWIRWVSSGIKASKMKIELFPEPPACLNSNPPCMIAQVMPYVITTDAQDHGGEGYYIWTIPKDLNGGLYNGNVQIRVTAYDRVAYADSDIFKISSVDVKPGCTSTKIITRQPLGNPGGTGEFEKLGLDTTAHPEIKRYRIQWFSGSWSDWYTPGQGDVDWKLNLDGTKRRVWSYFDDHVHQYEVCSDFVPPQPNKAPVINGVSGQSFVTVGQAGKWAIKAYDPEGGLLSFDVDWGDAKIVQETESAATKQRNVNAATFEHMYYKSGPKTIRFTVTDDTGQSTKASYDINVVEQDIGTVRNVKLGEYFTLAAGQKAQLVGTGYDIELVASQLVTCSMAPCPVFADVKVWKNSRANIVKLSSGTPSISGGLSISLVRAQRNQATLVIDLQEKPMIDVKIGQPFKLEEGYKARVKETGAVITLLDVPEKCDATVVPSLPETTTEIQAVPSIADETATKSSSVLLTGRATTAVTASAATTALETKAETIPSYCSQGYVVISVELPNGVSTKQILRHGQQVAFDTMNIRLSAISNGVAHFSIAKNTDSEGIVVGLGQKFRLQAGQTATLESDDISVILLDVDTMYTTQGSSASAQSGTSASASMVYKPRIAHGVLTSSKIGKIDFWLQEGYVQNLNGISLILLSVGISDKSAVFAFTKNTAEQVPVELGQVDADEQKVKMIMIKEKELMESGVTQQTPSTPSVEDTAQISSKAEKTCDGCTRGELCIGVGIRTKDDKGTATYCDVDKSMRYQKQDNAECENNFECRTNTCSSGRCVDLQRQLEESNTAVQKVLAWFKKIFE